MPYNSPNMSLAFNGDVFEDHTIDHVIGRVITRKYSKQSHVACTWSANRQSYNGMVFAIVGACEINDAISNGGKAQAIVPALCFRGIDIGRLDKVVAPHRAVLRKPAQVGQGRDLVGVGLGAGPCKARRGQAHRVAIGRARGIGRIGPHPIRGSGDKSRKRIGKGAGV